MSEGVEVINKAGMMTEVANAEGVIFNDAEVLPHAPDLYAYQRLADYVASFDAITEADIERYHRQGFLAIEHGFAAAEVAAAGGGTLTITFQSDIPSLDPALGYDIESWPAQQALYNGLLTYASHSTALVPDLAAAPPTISADARTFTFRLRKGVRFSNGRELNAGDVQYTFTRLIDPATASPYQSWYTGIRGADAFIKHKTKSVAGIQALDPYTVRFQLSTPNVAFLMPSPCRPGTSCPAKPWPAGASILATILWAAGPLCCRAGPTASRLCLRAIPPISSHACPGSSRLSFCSA